MFRSIRNILTTLFFGVLTGVIILVIKNNGWLMNIELTVYDQMVQLDFTSHRQDNPIVLIGITEQDIKKIGSWPLTDLTIAQILRALSGLKPSVIGLDIYRDMPVPPGKEELIRVFNEEANIVTVRKVGDNGGEGISKVYVLQGNELSGSNDIIIDPDGVVRRGLLFISDRDENVPSFSLLLALMYLKDRDITPQPYERDPSLMKLGRKVFVPLRSNDGGYKNIDSMGYQYMIDYRHAPFKQFSLSELLINKKLKEQDIKGKVVIIGSVAESTKDFFFTPLGSNLIYSNFLSGIALHGIMTNSIIYGALWGDERSQPVPDWIEDGAIILWALLGALIGNYAKSLRWFTALFSINISVLMLSTWMLFASGLWMPLVPQILSTTFAGFLTSAYVFQREKRDRMALMMLFSSHVSKDIAQKLWEDRNLFMSQGRPLSTKMPVTVLFTDLAGFTTLSEKLAPERLMDWLNEYMTEMTTIVIAHKGIVNKYIGDAVMAVFGIPVARTLESEIAEDAYNAVSCGIEMGRKLQELNQRWERQGIDQTAMRIGIASGDAVAGAVGSSHRMEYTVIGDIVNTASRLESCLKEKFLRSNSCWRVIINQRAYQYVKEHFQIQPLGSINLKGKELKEEIYQVVDFKKDNLTTKH